MIEAYQNSINTADINVIGNIFYNIGNRVESNPIQIYSANTYTIERVKITGNIFRDDRGANSWSYNGIFDYSAGTTKNITVSENIFEGMLNRGIYLVAIADNYTISNNQFVDIPTGIHADVTHCDDLVIDGNRFNTVTTPISISDAQVVRPFITNNNWYGCTNDPVTTSAVGLVSTNNVNKDGIIAVTSGIMLIKRTIGVYGIAGMNANFASVADKVAQNRDLGEIIPAKARVIAIEIICNTSCLSATTGYLRLGAGNASAGEQFIAAATCYGHHDVRGIIDATRPAAVIMNEDAATHIWIQGSLPDDNWDTFTAGDWEINITYIQY
jgi:hypothetical protein